MISLHVYAISGRKKGRTSGISRTVSEKLFGALVLKIMVGQAAEIVLMNAYLKSNWATLCSKNLGPY